MALLIKYLDILLYSISFCIVMFFMINYVKPFHNLTKTKKAKLIVNSYSNLRSYILYILIIFLILRNVIKNYSLYLLISSCAIVFIIILCGFLYHRIISKIYFFEDGIFIKNKFIHYGNIKSFYFMKNTDKYCTLKISYTFIEKQLITSYKISCDSPKKIRSLLQLLNIVEVNIK